jgi:hypothetical protein
MEAVLPDQKLKYVIIVPVWGPHHTGLFLRFCIQFLLTDGNVGAFPNRALQVVVMSTRADFARMRNDPKFVRLSNTVDMIETEIDEIIDLSVPHRAMTECYLHAVRALDDPDNTVTIFPTPDCILSRNALAVVASRMEAGWRGVMVCGLRITLEEAGPALDAVLAKPDGARGLEERQLTTLVLEHLHHITLSCDISSDRFMINWPSHVYWVAPDRSWLFAHCFHLHPLAVRGRPAQIDITSTIDGDYLVGLGVGADDLYICQNSDELLCVEISPGKKKVAVKSGRFSKYAFVLFFLSNCNALHRAFFSHAIRWRGTKDAEVPAIAVSEANRLTAAVTYFGGLAPTVVEIKKRPLLWKIVRAFLEPGQLRDFIKVRYARIFEG